MNILHISNSCQLISIKFKCIYNKKYIFLKNLIINLIDCNIV
jgi:hypothetical protein